jgi:hypothetical protein
MLLKTEGRAAQALETSNTVMLFPPSLGNKMPRTSAVTVPVVHSSASSYVCLCQSVFKWLNHIKNVTLCDRRSYVTLSYYSCNFSSAKMIQLL